MMNPFDPTDYLRHFRDQLSGLASADYYERMLRETADAMSAYTRHQQQLASGFQYESALKEVMRDYESQQRLMRSALGNYQEAQRWTDQYLSGSVTSAALGTRASDFIRIANESFGYEAILEDARRRLDSMRSVSDVFAASSVTATQGIVDSVSDFLKATLHDKYLGSIADLVGQIDFDAVAVAAVDATERFRRAFPEEVQVRLGDVAEALDEADLGVVREAVEIAVSEAIERAAEEGVFAGRPVMWFMLNTLVAILVTLLQPWLVQLVEQKSIGESGKHETSRIASDVRLADDLVVVTASSLFLRVGPHTTQRILGTLHYGQVVRVLRRSSGWLRVSYVEAVDGQMRSGWVKGKYTSPLTTEAARMIWCAVCVHP